MESKIFEIMIVAIDNILLIGEVPLTLTTMRNPRFLTNVRKDNDILTLIQPLLDNPSSISLKSINFFYSPSMLLAKAYLENVKNIEIINNLPKEESSVPN